MANTYRRMLLNTEIVSPSYSYVNKNTTTTTTTTTSSSSSYMSEANFDTNMVIILAALLCALICALGLNSIVRCALRCSRRLSLETPEQAAVRLALTGLKKKDLCQLPISIYDASVAVEDEPQVLVATECPICLGEFIDGEKVRVLPKCNHAFHVTCIDTWLLSHSSCPICRHSLLQSTFNTSSSSSSTAKQQQQQRLLLLQVTTTTTPQQTTTNPPPHPPVPVPMPVI